MRALREIRLQVNTLRACVITLLEKLQVWYAQHTCPHLFQAARVGSGGGRICKICGLAQTLSKEEYFALFGEKGWTAIYYENKK